LLVCSYHLILFSDYIADDARFFGGRYGFKAAFGWSMLAIIFLGVLVNVLIIARSTVTALKQLLRVRSIKRMRQ